MATVKKKPVKKYIGDFGFYSIAVRATGRTQAEAKKKMIEKLNKMNIKTLISPHTTFIDRED